jgi:hypothetical protein
MDKPEILLVEVHDAQVGLGGWLTWQSATFLQHRGVKRFVKGDGNQSQSRS